jgi:hypothetical protein
MHSESCDSARFAESSGMDSNTTMFPYCSVLLLESKVSVTRLLVCDVSRNLIEFNSSLSMKAGLSIDRPVTGLHSPRSSRSFVFANAEWVVFWPCMAHSRYRYFIYFTSGTKEGIARVDPRVTLTLIIEASFMLPDDPKSPHISLRLSTFTSPFTPSKLQSLNAYVNLASIQRKVRKSNYRRASMFVVFGVQYSIHFLASRVLAD